MTRAAVWLLVIGLSFMFWTGVVAIVLTIAKAVVR